MTRQRHLDVHIKVLLLVFLCLSWKQHLCGFKFILQTRRPLNLWAHKSLHEQLFSVCHQTFLVLLTSWTSDWGSQDLQTDLKRDTYVSRNSVTKMSHTNLSVSKCHLFSVCGPSLCPRANGHRINTEMLWSYQTDTFLRLIASLDSGRGKEKIPKNVTRSSAWAALFQTKAECDAAPYFC